MTIIPRKRRVSLSSEDVQAIRGLIRFADSADRNQPEYIKEVCAKERALPETAKVAWYHWTSDRLRAVVSRWVPAFSIERTGRGGYRVCRFIQNRGCYAKRPLRVPPEGWTQAAIDNLRFLIRVPCPR